MKKVFISRAGHDDEMADIIKRVLNKHYITTWLDKDDMLPGKRFWQNIFPAISDSRYFLALITKDYLKSENCPTEFHDAFEHFKEKNHPIIPVVFKGKEEMREMLSDGDVTISRFIEGNYYYFDPSTPEVSAEKLANYIQRDQRIVLSPPEVKEIDGTLIQEIKMRIAGEGDLDPSFLAEWGFDIRYFLKDSEDDSKPIRRDIPIGLNGPVPNWLWVNLAMSFYNKLPVYTYNTRRGSNPYYVCAYDNGAPEQLGKVLNPEVAL